MYGSNAATYKFAFAGALLEAARTGAETVSLQELAPTYLDLLSGALRREPRQGTAASSRFLTACRAHVSGALGREEVLAATVRWGFANVIDAFPVLAGAPAPVAFYQDRRRDSGVRGLVLSAELQSLARSACTEQVVAEIDARWRLVETAWAAGVNPGLVGPVSYDRTSQTFGVRCVPVRRSAAGVATPRRRSVTGVVAALNGYQDGRCGYCQQLMDSSGVGPAVVDHVLPFRLLQTRWVGAPPWPGPPLDAVWNLVLACAACNSQKGPRPPASAWMPWLLLRNDDLIASHHPLRASLISQTGPTPATRQRTVVAAYEQAVTRLAAAWTPPVLPG